MTRHVVIVGGGVAGLSAGCYALRSGFRVTIVEHNLALGGVCTACGVRLADGTLIPADIVISTSSAPETILRLLGGRYDAERTRELRPAVRSIDLATPLTYWGMARSWRGSYEGWMPRGDSFFGGVKKKLRGLEGFYMAGQWVEPGGGVPTAVMSGRQVVQLVCADHKHVFRGANDSR